MRKDHSGPARPGIEGGLDRLSSDESVQSNCMFQLALMLARIALEPCPDEYREETAQALMGLIRAKPKGNVLRLFGAKPKAGPDATGLRAAG